MHRLPSNLRGRPEGMVYEPFGRSKPLEKSVTMKRVALMMILIAALVPAAAGAEASYQSISAGSAVNDVAIAPDGRYMVAGTDGGRIVYLREDGTVPWNVSAESTVTSIAVAGARGYVAAGTGAGDVLLLDEKDEIGRAHV